MIRILENYNDPVQNFGCQPYCRKQSMLKASRVYYYQLDQVIHKKNGPYSQTIMPQNVHCGRQGINTKSRN